MINGLYIYINSFYIISSFGLLLTLLIFGILKRNVVFLNVVMTYFSYIFFIFEFIFILLYFFFPLNYVSYSFDYFNVLFVWTFFDHILLFFIFCFLFCVHQLAALQTKTLYFYKNLCLYFFTILVFFFLLATRDFTALFFLSELLSILIFVILASNNQGKTFNLSVIHYFLVSCLLTGLFGFFVLLMYNFTDTGDFLINLYRIVTYNNKCYYCIAGIFVILLVKLGFAPAHFIFFDVYSSLEWTAFGFIANFSKLVLFVVLVRIWNVFLVFPNNTFLLFVICLSLLIGAVGPFYAYTIRRLLLYSSLFTSSLSLFFVFLGYSFLGVLYILFYTLLVSMLILAFFFFENQKNVLLVTLDNLNGSSFFWLKYCIISYLFILAGFPPFVLFWFKLYVYSFILHFFGFIFLGFILILFTVITYAYLRICKFLLFEAFTFNLKGSLLAFSFIYHSFFFYVAFGSAYYFLEHIFAFSFI